MNMHIEMHLTTTFVFVEYPWFQGIKKEIKTPTCIVIIIWHNIVIIKGTDGPVYNLTEWLHAFAVTCFHFHVRDC